MTQEIMQAMVSGGGYVALGLAGLGSAWGCGAAAMAAAGAWKKYFVGEEFWKAASAIYARVPDLNEAQTEKIICSSTVLKDGNGYETGFFLTSSDLASYLSEHPLKDSTVLIKGSRGTRMETVLENL